MGEENICPFRNYCIILPGPPIPENYCTVRDSYCTWPCEYERCDFYKKAIRTKEMLENIKKENSNG